MPFYCKCGCGGEVGVWDADNRRYGQVKGEPKSYIHNHHPKTPFPFRPINPNRKIVESREYRRIVEAALGPLPPKAVVHHADGNRFNNTNSNFVVCQNEAYHRLLHMRMKAKAACGNPDWRKCKHCKGWDNPANFHDGGHRECKRAYERAAGKRRRAARKLQRLEGVNVK